MDLGRPSRRRSHRAPFERFTHSRLPTTRLRPENNGDGQVGFALGWSGFVAAAI